MGVSGLLLLGLNGVISPVFAFIKLHVQIFHTQKELYGIMETEHALEITLRKATHPYNMYFLL